MRSQAAASSAAPAPTAPPAETKPATVASLAQSAQAAAAPVAESEEEPSKAWYERLRLRGYTQLRYNGFLSGDDTAPDGLSRLRSVHDASINESGGFSLRRVRLVLEGDVTDRVSLYLQHDFGAAVNNQSGTERRENFGQLRDAYVDVFPTRDRTVRIRFGQSKVPFGWENLQSSSNRLTLDRSDAINSGVPGERDIGVVAYYTPTRVQAIWDRLKENDQKLFGNYGAFGVGVYNGQGTNRTERNNSLMTVAMATWPFELDGLGPMFEGQVLELGGSAMLNKFRPEIRAGGVSAVDYDDNRVGLHAILYPQPFGIQAEWSGGRGPEFDETTRTIREQSLGGGYVQLMYDMGETAVGRVIPYARWQRYRGGWKASTNAPRLETDEFELGFEWHFMESLELTTAYARMKRREPDERRVGRAEGDLIRTQLQWSY
ncbi:porin [Phenylobacterium deserti]|nr:porin [Phenylobacterium deserti]